jgi:hypothetical protein
LPSQTLQAYALNEHNLVLTRITHERLCCNRGFAAATGRLSARSLDVLFKYASGPRGSACPSRNATARFGNEPS